MLLTRAGCVDSRYSRVSAGSLDGDCPNAALTTRTETRLQPAVCADIFDLLERVFSLCMLYPLNMAREEKHTDQVFEFLYLVTKLLVLPIAHSVVSRLPGGG